MGCPEAGETSEAAEAAEEAGVVQRPVEQWASSYTGHAPTYIPSPNAEEFILATRNGPAIERRVLILMANRGAGKTSCAICAIVALATRIRDESPAALPLIVAVVRDSFVNLERTTMQTIREFERKGLPMEWLDQGRQAISAEGGKPLIHWHFFGMDRPADTDKYQGFTSGVLWLEEVAAAADLSAGIPSAAFGLGIASLRQPDVPKRCLITMNPPDEDAWILKVEELVDDYEVPNFVVKRWDMKPDEKEQHFRRLAERARSEKEREAWSEAADEHEAYLRSSEAALKAIGRSDLATRLVGGEIGEVKVGEPVVPNFIRAMHVVPQLGIVGHWPILRFWDAAGSPSCVIAQALGDNGIDGLNILASHTSLNTSMEQHIKDWVLPTMADLGLLPSSPPRRRDGTADPYATAVGAPRRRQFEFRDIGDPSMQWEGNTVKRENTSGNVIYELLGGTLEPGPIDWDSRREALSSGFYRPGTGDRQRFIQIDKRYNKTLIAALGGRFRYPRREASGQITMTIEAAKRASGPQYCVDESTEILTVEGWRRHGQLQVGELIYGFDMKAGRLRETTLRNVHRFDERVEGLRFHNKLLDMVVTKDHKCVVRRRLTRHRSGTPIYFKPELVRAADLVSSHYFVRAGYIARSRCLSDEFVRLCAWIVTEGSYYDGERGLPVTLSQSHVKNPKYVEAIERLLSKIPGAVTRATRDDMVEWSIGGELALMIRALMPGKVPSPTLIRRLSARQHRMFLYETIRGDGTWNRGAEGPLPEPRKNFWVRGDSPEFLQRRLDVIEALQHMACLGGIQTGVREYKARVGTMHALCFRRARRSCINDAEREEVMIDGTWCPETGTGTWIARRGGHVFITGNSGVPDALAYGLATIFPAAEWVRRVVRRPVPQSPHPRSWLGV